MKERNGHHAKQERKGGGEAGLERESEEKEGNGTRGARQRGEVSKNVEMRERERQTNTEARGE